MHLLQLFLSVINYYDKYGFTDPTLAGRNYQQINPDDVPVHSDYVTGKLTASKVRILPTGDYLSNVKGIFKNPE